MRFPRRIVVTSAVVVAVAAGGAFIGDTVSASRVEAELSTRIRPASPGIPAPSVMIGGGPTSRWSGPDRLSSVTVRAEGVERPLFGPLTVEAESTDVHLTDDRSDSLNSGHVAVSAHITSNELGRALGLNEVRLAAADDPSLAGGAETRARITGTVNGTDSRISTFVDLVVDERGAHLVPVAPATGPGGIAEQDRALAMEQTSLTLPPDLLPLGRPIETLTVRGGSITASGTGGPGTAPLNDLTTPDL